MDNLELPTRNLSIAEDLSGMDTALELPWDKTRQTKRDMIQELLAGRTSLLGAS